MGKEVDEFTKRREILNRNLENFYSLLWGQCEPTIKDKVKTLPEYSQFSSDCDFMGPHKAIREVTYNYQSQKYQALQVHVMNTKIANIKQGKYQTPSTYLERFKSQVEVIEEGEGNIGFSPSMIKMELLKCNPPTDIETASMEQYEAACETAKQKYLAITFLTGATNKEHTHMMNTLENNYLRGNHDAYPATLEKVFELLLNWRGVHDRQHKTPTYERYNHGHTFVQEDNPNSFCRQNNGNNNGCVPCDKKRSNKKSNNGGKNDNNKSKNKDKTSQQHQGIYPIIFTLWKLVRRQVLPLLF